MAWLRKADPDASPELRALTDRWRASPAGMPSVLEVLMLRPALLKGVMAMNYGATFGATGLGRRREELIAVLVSALNRCVYCTVGHAAFLLEESEVGEGALTAWVRALWDSSDGERAPVQVVDAAARSIGAAPFVDEEDGCLLRYAARLTLIPQHVEPVRIQQMRDAGFGDEAILDIANVAACFAYMNRVASGLGVSLRRHLDLARRLLGDAVVDVHLEWVSEGLPRP